MAMAREHGLALGFAGAVVLVWAGLTGWAASRAVLPPEATGTMLAVFPPGADAGTVYDAVIDAGARPLRTTWMAGAWVVTGDEPGLAGRLESRGALATFTDFPFGGPRLGGCAAVSVDAARPIRYRLQP